jgi:hypothetical protein
MHDQASRSTRWRDASIERELRPPSRTLGAHAPRHVVVDEHTVRIFDEARADRGELAVSTFGNRVVLRATFTSNEAGAAQTTVRLRATRSIAWSRTSDSSLSSSAYQFNRRIETAQMEVVRAEAALLWSRSVLRCNRRVNAENVYILRRRTSVHTRRRHASVDRETSRIDSRSCDEEGSERSATIAG